MRSPTTAAATARATNGAATGAATEATRRTEPGRPWSGLAGSLCVLVLLAAPAGRAGADECRDACSDARQTCMDARAIAQRSCWGDCRDTVAEATRSAHQVCEQEALTPAACGKLLRQVVAGAERACRADCGIAAKEAKAVCKAERGDCRQACVASVDPACREACTASFRTCRQDLETCAGGCRDDRQAAIDACKQQMTDTCDPAVLHECIEQARSDARSCVQECHDETTCADTLRECVDDCAETPPADATNL